MMDEIDRYKQELANAAMESVNQKENAITDEIRQFARDNPEITANLLRNWLKESEA
jgi:flagellar biosynthesis/type III secretory pathway M-ring protein FliF/YscJ